MYAATVAKRITADADTAPGLTVVLQRSVAQAHTPINLPQLVSSALRPQLFAVAVNPKRPSKERSCLQNIMNFLNNMYLLLAVALRQASEPLGHSNLVVQADRLAVQL